MGYGMDEEDWGDQAYYDSAEELGAKWETMKERYDENAKKKVGKIIQCPGCARLFLKKTYHQKFCCTRCKDYYWNTAPNRIDRTRRYNELQD